MGQIKAAGDQFLRAFATDGVPSSGANEPDKGEGKVAFAFVDAATSALALAQVAGGAIAKDNLASLNADLAHAANKLAFVVNDSTASYNGVYIKVGGSGSGSWTLTGLSLPVSFINDLSVAESAIADVQAATIDTTGGLLTASGNVGSGLELSLLKATQGDVIFGVDGRVVDAVLLGQNLEALDIRFQDIRDTPFTGSGALSVSGSIVDQGVVFSLLGATSGDITIGGTPNRVVMAEQLQPILATKLNVSAKASLSEVAAGTALDKYIDPYGLKVQINNAVAGIAASENPASDALQGQIDVRALEDLSNVDDAIGREALGVSFPTQAQAEAASVNSGAMTPLRSKQQLRTVVEYINAREYGAVADGTTDDRAALQAAVDYAKTLGTYFYGGCIKVRLPRGTMKFTSTHPTKTDRVIDLTGANNVIIEGEGYGSTTLFFTPNVSLFKNDETKAAPLTHTILGRFTILGPYQAASAPLVNVASCGIDLGASNGVSIDTVRVYACGTGMAWRDCYHCEIVFPRITGLGNLACRDGLYAKDGDITLTENAVGIFGGRVYGCTRYGYRGECISGSSIVGLELVGCGEVAMYLGDSPQGKDLKWFNAIGLVLDTSGDLLKVSKGTSTLAHLLNISGAWAGFANDDSPAVGIGVELSGIAESTFAFDTVANTHFGLNVTGCGRVTVAVRSLQGYDHVNAGGVAIICNNTSHSRFDIGTCTKAPGSASSTAFVEQGTSNYNLITGIFDGAVTTIGANSNKAGCIVY